MSRPADPNAKEALVAAARAEFAKKGLRGARVEDITAACGLSKGAFYLHFETKEGLFKTLVDAFLAEMGACSEERVADLQRFSAEALADVAALGEYVACQTEHDLCALEIMWRYRDVLSVLISGCSGTAFEGTLWDILDVEQARVTENFRELQKLGCSRQDLPPELFGSLVIGTYLLVGKQMTREQVKPDLARWASALHTIVHEGSSPRDQAPRAAAPAVESVAPKSVRPRKDRRTRARSSR